MEENNKLPLLLVLSLPILLLISTEVAYISFNVFGQEIYLLSLVFPLTFLASLLIFKKSNSKMAITLVILALIMQCMVFVLKWVLLSTIDYKLMEITFLGFFISHLILLLGYEVLRGLKRTNKYGNVLILLLIASFIECMFYIVLFSNITWVGLIINLIIRIIYLLIITKILVKEKV